MFSHGILKRPLPNYPHWFGREKLAVIVKPTLWFELNVKSQRYNKMTTSIVVVVQ